MEWKAQGEPQYGVAPAKPLEGALGQTGLEVHSIAAPPRANIPKMSPLVLGHAVATKPHELFSCARPRLPRTKA